MWNVNAQIDELIDTGVLRRLLAFYVHDHNHVLPHSAYRGQTPDERYFGTGEAVPPALTSRAAAARRARVEANRSGVLREVPVTHRVRRLLTAVPTTGLAHSYAEPPGEPRPVPRVEEAEPCRGSDSLIIACRLLYGAAPAAWGTETVSASAARFDASRFLGVSTILMKTARFRRRPSAIPTYCSSPPI